MAGIERLDYPVNNQEEDARAAVRRPYLEAPTMTADEEAVEDEMMGYPADPPEEQEFDELYGGHAT